VATKREFAMITFRVEHQRNKKKIFTETQESEISGTEAILKRRSLIIEDGPLFLSTTQTL
jgi:hypothetical protein